MFPCARVWFFCILVFKKNTPMHATSPPPPPPPPPPLSAFSLTHVEYVSGDAIGFLCAGLSLAPVFLVVALVTAAVGRRDLHVTAGLVGQLLNTVLNVVLKRAIAQPRPAFHSAVPAAVGFSPHGMPSNHTQFVWFFAAFWIPWVLFRPNNHSRRRGSNGSAPGSACTFVRATAAAAIFLGASAVTFARVYLTYHTVPQVVVGAVCGAIVGLIWQHITWSFLVPSVFPAVVRSAFGVSLGLVDFSAVEDVVAWEHACATATTPEDWAAIQRWRDGKLASD